MKTHLHFMGHAACSAGASNLAYSEEPTCGNCRKILERMRAKLTRQQSAQGAPGKTMYSARRHCPVCRRTINTARGKFVSHPFGPDECLGSGELAPTVTSTQIGR